MSTSTRIHILLPEDTLSRLDMKRGLVPRSSYIRDLVERALVMDGSPEEPLVNETKTLPKATAPVPDARKSGGMISKMKIVPETKHRHRFERRAEIGHEMRGTLQVPIYRYECGDPDCPEFQERS